MKRFPGKLILAVGVVLAILSVPFWIPSLQAMAAEQPASDANPFETASSYYIFDSGYFTGETLQTVQSAPQVFAWSGGDSADWSAETGFIMGSLLDEEGGRIFVTEQRNVNVDSLAGFAYPADSTYPPSDTWPVYLSVLDAETGEVTYHQRLDDLAVGPTGYYLHPIGVEGDVVYLVNYDAIRNLHSYDMSTNTAGEEFWDVCPAGYMMETIFLSEPARVAALCDQGVTITDITTGEQQTVKVPQLGPGEYETGNGMFVANGELYVVDSNGGVMLTVDTETMQLSKIIDYRASLAKEESNLLGDALAWLSDQIAGRAQAKRWMAITSVSADERWLAIDGGIFGPAGIRDILVVDLHGEQATRAYKLGGSPAQLAFGADGNLLAVFESGAMRKNDGVLLHIDSGETMAINVPANGWLENLIPKR
jgi:hypothetical protein